MVTMTQDEDNISLFHHEGLGEGQQSNATINRPSDAPNQLAHSLIKLGQVKSDYRWEKQIRDEWQKHLHHNNNASKPEPVLMSELEFALTHTDAE